MLSLKNLQYLQQRQADYKAERAAIIESFCEMADLPADSEGMFKAFSLPFLRSCVALHNDQKSILSLLYWGYDLGTPAGEDRHFTEEKLMWLLDFGQPYQFKVGRQMLIHILHSVMISNDRFRDYVQMEFHEGQHADLATAIHGFITIYLTERTPEWEKKEDSNWYTHNDGAHCWSEVSNYFRYPSSEMGDLFIEHHDRHDDIAEYLNARALSTASVDLTALRLYLDSETTALSAGTL